MANLLIVLQPPPTPGSTPSTIVDASSAPVAAGSKGGMFAGIEQMALPLIILVVAYFVLIRPQQKRLREQDKVRDALKKGDIVRTSSGIRGEIVAIDTNDVSLLIAEKTRINVLRTHIAQIEPSETK